MRPGPLGAILAALLIVLAPPRPAPAEPAAPPWVESDRASLMVREAMPVLEPRAPATLPSWLSGGAPLGLGLDVRPLHLRDPGTAISFDLKLGWPSATAAVERGTLLPYLTVGPALFVNPPPDADSLLSWVLLMARRRNMATFVGQWVPTLLLIGLYNKLVKLEGSE